MVSFDQEWKLHLGDVTGAQVTTFDDSAWTALDVRHDWSILKATSGSLTTDSVSVTTVTGSTLGH